MRRARSASQTTVDPDEVRRFQSLASKWWDEQGEFAALHAMNDLRVPFIRCVFAHNTHSIFILALKCQDVTPKSLSAQGIDWRRRQATVSKHNLEEIQPRGI